MSFSGGGLTAVGIGVRQERQTCFFTAVDPNNVSMLTLRYEPNESRNVPYKLKWIRLHDAIFLFDVKVAQDEGLLFWQSYWMDDSMSREFVWKLSEENVYCEEKELLSGWNQSLTTDLMVSKKVLDHDRARQELISHWTHKNCDFDRNKKSCRTFSRKKDKYLRSLVQIKKIINEQGNTGAFDFWNALNRIQCIHCHRYTTVGLVYCYYGRIIVHTSQDPTSEGQTQCKRGAAVRVAAAFFLIKGTREKILDSRMNNKHEGKAKQAHRNSGHASVLDRWTKDDVYRAFQLKNWFDRRTSQTDGSVDSGKPELPGHDG